MLSSTQPEVAYLLGLVTGRGHLFLDSKVIAIEFSHTNESMVGIAHCIKCGYLVTKTPGTTNYKCKNTNCSSIYSENELNRKTYNQQVSTMKSIQDIIIPLLKSVLNCEFKTFGNSSMTLLILDFKENLKAFNDIVIKFNGSTSFDKFHIPQDIRDSSDENIKVEFINGLLDTAGFNNSGGWLPRSGKNNYGRMRSYFQIVRNWYLPVEIDNFLRDNFNLYTQTIDWGHPNIRDSGLSDYYNTSQTSWSREHQVKFFPELFKQFRFRIKHKQDLFEELIKHNEAADFTGVTEDWFPPSTAKPKAYHPGEADPRIPEVVRKHFDAFWQINLALGCKYLQAYVSKLENPRIFGITGKDEPLDLEKVTKEWDEKRKELTQEIIKSNEETEKHNNVKKAKNRALRTTPELELYEPIKNYMKVYLRSSYGSDPIVYDTSAYNLNQFLRINNKELLDIFNYCDEYRIKPDVVGFIPDHKHLIFVEVKATYIDLKNLGQLVGYCMVAQPEEAILISDKQMSISLVKVLEANPEILQYAPSKKIKVAQWRDNKFNFVV